MDETVLESMLIRLLGDGSSYVKMMQDAQTATAQSTQFIEAQGKRIEQISQQVQDFGRTAVSALASLGATAWLKSAFDMYKETETVTLKLKAAISANGGAVDATLASYQNFAKTIRDTTGASSDETLGLLKKAEAYGVTGAAAENAVQSAIRLAAATDSDAASAIRVTAALQQGNVAQARMYAHRMDGLRGIRDETTFLNKVQTLMNIGQAQAGEYMNSTEGVMKRYYGTLKAITKQFGEVVADGVKPVVKWLTELNQKFIGLDPTLKRVIVTGAFLAAGLLAIGPAIGSITAVMGPFISLFMSGWGLLLKIVPALLAPLSTVGAVFASLSAIFGWWLIPLVAGLAVAGIAIATFIQSSGGMRGAWDKVKNWGASAWTWITEKTTAFVEWVTPYVTRGLEGLYLAWRYVSTYAGIAWDFVKAKVLAFVAWATPYAGQIAETFSEIWGLVVSVTAEVWDAVKSAVFRTVDVIAHEIRRVTGATGDSWQVIGDAAKMVWDSVRENVTKFVAWAGPYVSTWIATAAGLWNIVLTAGRFAFEFIQDTIAKVMGTSGGSVGQFAENAISLWGRISSTAGEVWQWVATKVGDFVAWSQPILNAYFGFITAWWGLIVDAAMLCWDGVKLIVDVWWNGYTLPLLTGAWRFITEMWTGIAGGADVNWRSVRDFIVDALLMGEFALKNFKQVWDWAVVGAAYGIVKLSGQTTHFFTEVMPAAIEQVVNFWVTAFKKGFDFAQLGWENLKALFRGEMTLGNFANSIRTGFESALSSMPNFQIPARTVSDLENQLRREFEANGAALGEAFNAFRTRRMAEINAVEWPGLTPAQAEIARAERAAAAAGTSIGNAFAGGAGKGAHEFDNVLRYSGEALRRIAAYREMLNKRPTGPTVGAPTGASLPTPPPIPAVPPPIVPPPIAAITPPQVPTGIEGTIGFVAQFAGFGGAPRVNPVVTPVSAPAVNMPGIAVNANLQGPLLAQLNLLSAQLNQLQNGRVDLTLRIVNLPAIRDQLAVLSPVVVRVVLGPIPAAGAVITDVNGDVLPGVVVEGVLVLGPPNVPEVPGIVAGADWGELSEPVVPGIEAAVGAAWDVGAPFMPEVPAIVVGADWDLEPPEVPGIVVGADWDVSPPPNVELPGIVVGASWDVEPPVMPSIPELPGYSAGGGWTVDEGYENPPVTPILLPSNPATILTPTLPEIVLPNVPTLTPEPRDFAPVPTLGLAPALEELPPATLVEFEAPVPRQFTPVRVLSVFTIPQIAPVPPPLLTAPRNLAATSDVLGLLLGGEDEENELPVMLGAIAPTIATSAIGGLTVLTPPVTPEVQIPIVSAENYDLEDLEVDVCLEWESVEPPTIVLEPVVVDTVLGQPALPRVDVPNHSLYSIYSMPVIEIATILLQPPPFTVDSPSTTLSTLNAVDLPVDWVVPPFEGPDLEPLRAPLDEDYRTTVVRVDVLRVPAEVSTLNPLPPIVQSVVAGETEQGAPQFFPLALSLTPQTVFTVPTVAPVLPVATFAIPAATVAPQTVPPVPSRNLAASADILGALLFDEDDLPTVKAPAFPVVKTPDLFSTWTVTMPAPDFTETLSAAPQLFPLATVLAVANAPLVPQVPPTATPAAALPAVPTPPATPAAVPVDVLGPLLLEPVKPGEILGELTLVPVVLAVPPLPEIEQVVNRVLSNLPDVAEINSVGYIDQAIQGVVNSVVAEVRVNLPELSTFTANDVEVDVPEAPTPLVVIETTPQLVGQTSVTAVDAGNEDVVKAIGAAAKAIVAAIEGRPGIDLNGSGWK